MFGAPADHEEEEAVKDAIRWGAGEDQIAALKEKLAGSPARIFPGVWPANAPAVLAFLVAATQWRTAIAAAGDRVATLWVGLDYAGAAAAWSALRMEVDAADFAGVRTMEGAARDLMNGKVTA